MSDFKDPILITGCARSGTSMIAGIVDLCGAFGGATSGPTPYNAKGMFENETLRNKIIKPYLAHVLGVDPMGQSPLPTPSLIKTNPYPNDLRKEVLAVFRHEGLEPNQSWYYKGAKMMLIWEIWRDAFPQAQWLVVRRPDDQIIQSCENARFMRKRSGKEGWQDWIDHHKRRWKEMHLAVNYREVWSDRVVTGDFAEIKSAIEDFGLKWKETTVRNFVDPSLYSLGVKDG